MFSVYILKPIKSQRITKSEGMIQQEIDVDENAAYQITVIARTTEWVIMIKTYTSNDIFLSNKTWLWILLGVLGRIAVI